MNVKSRGLVNIAYKPLTGLVTGDLRVELPESGRGTSSTCQLGPGGGEKLGLSGGYRERRAGNRFHISICSFSTPAV